MNRTLDTNALSDQQHTKKLTGNGTRLRVRESGHTVDEFFGVLEQNAVFCAHGAELR